MRPKIVAMPIKIDRISDCDKNVDKNYDPFVLENYRGEKEKRYIHSNFHKFFYRFLIIVRLKFEDLFEVEKID